MTVVVEHESTVNAMLKNGPTRQGGEEAAVLVYVRLMFLRIGKWREGVSLTQLK